MFPSLLAPFGHDRVGCAIRIWSVAYIVFKVVVTKTKQQNKTNKQNKQTNNNKKTEPFADFSDYPKCPVLSTHFVIPKAEVSQVTNLVLNLY